MNAAYAATPLPLRGRSMVVISSIDWDFLWQGHQEIASRFAAAGNDVLFVENTGVRSVRLGDVSRLIRTAAKLLRLSRSAPVPRGVTVVTPMLLPFPRSGLAAMVNERSFIPRLAASLRRSAGTDPILLTYLPTPTALRLVDHLRGPGSVVVYYCVADFRELSDLGTDIVTSEEQLVRSADLVFVQGETFRKRFAGLNPRIYEFQSGVDPAVFYPGVAPARELRSIPRPVIGYSGGLHRHVDLGLLVKVAEAFPHGTLVVVGPFSRDVAALRALPNVHFLGHRRFTELPSIIASFDVALIPYVRSAYTDTVFPTKLFEYLAAGRPIVSTDLPEVRKLGMPEFAVRIAGDADRFLGSIKNALAEPAALWADRRAECARPRDWSAIVRDMAQRIVEAAPPYR